ncbi:hypothetical protein [Bradyrhizobium sp.]|uniref:hypothetical protein n=1 Tax=Bradyrhizobium sp. TaxID=376 RepID=UPI0025BA5E02|nr:hypothetical protein [Bradyrhizobium sp.]
MGNKRTILLSSVLIAAATAAGAQAPPTPATPPTPTAPPSTARPLDCAPIQQPGAAVPNGTTTGQRAEPLSDKLARADGVLCPPRGIDPEIVAPTPDAGNTPVIPPPGSPGGDPTIRPK